MKKILSIGVLMLGVFMTPIGVHADEQVTEPAPAPELIVHEKGKSGISYNLGDGYSLYTEDLQKWEDRGYSPEDAMLSTVYEKIAPSTNFWDLISDYDVDYEFTTTQTDAHELGHYDYIYRVWHNTEVEGEKVSTDLYFEEGTYELFMSPLYKTNENFVGDINGESAPYQLVPTEIDVFNFDAIVEYFGLQGIDSEGDILKVEKLGNDIEGGVINNLDLIIKDKFGHENKITITYVSESLEICMTDPDSCTGIGEGKPSIPWTPLEPATPIEPTIPLTPLEPATPIEPEVPVTPVNPTPVDPSTPVVPVEPSTPVEPEQPIVPTVPVAPETPVETPSVPVVTPEILPQTGVASGSLSAIGSMTSLMGALFVTLKRKK